MFVSGSLDSLDPEKRRKLAEYLEVRNEYLQTLVELNELRIRVLVEPTAANEDAVNDHVSVVIAPLRTRHDELMTDLEPGMIEAIAGEGLGF